MPDLRILALLSALLPSLGPAAPVPAPRWPAASSVTAAADSGRKLALIIAIARYPRATGYSRLNSDNDPPLVRAGLMRQGFDSAAIRIVTDSAATRAGILQALENLTATARPGDVVVVHYSGHGHQITDDNGDELDGLDELLVPFGARADVDPATYKGEQHIRDDELEPRLAALRRAVSPGGNVVVFIDACHSGSATRSSLPVRGGLPPIGKPAPTATRATTEGSGWFAPAPRTRGGDGLAPMVVFSAARQDQVAGEVWLDDPDLIAGSLSAGISRVLANLDAGGGQVSYRAVFDRLKSWMQGEVPLQTPQLEGDADVALFSGRAVTQKPYMRIAGLEGDSLVSLDGGTLVGLLPGSRLSFHPVGTQDPGRVTPLARGTVVRANELTATVRLEPGPTTAGMKNTWAFVTEYAFAEFRVRLQLDPRLPGAVRDALRTEFSRSGVIRLSDSRGDLVVRPGGAPTRGGSAVTVAWAQDTTAALIRPVDATTPQGRAELVDQVRSLARSAYLKQVDMQDPGIRVRMELVPATHQFAADGSCDPARSDTTHFGARLTEGNQWVLDAAAKDGWFLRFVNEGSDPAYLQVLDLLPNGDIGQLFPQAQLLGEDNLLPPGRTYTSKLCFWATEPTGTEVLKLFATRSRVDFRPVLQSRSPTRESGAHPLERLLGDTYAPTRTTPPAAPAGTGTTMAITLQIVSTSTAP